MFHLTNYNLAGVEDEDIKNIIIFKTQDDLIYFNKNSVNEERYVLSGSDFAKSIRIIDEKCDD